MVGPYVIWPAKEGMDFPKQEGQVTFEAGTHITTLDIYLTPDLASSSPTPKRFQVELYSPTGGASVHSQFGLANVTLVSNAASQSVWRLLDPLHQPLNPTIINQVLQGLKTKFTSTLTREQMTAVLQTLGKVLAEAEQTPLHSSSQNLTYDLLCVMANPSRVDTRGLSYLAEVAERFAFSLISHVQYTLLPVPAASSADCRNLSRIQLTEFRTEHWFLSSDTVTAVSGKVFSVSLQERRSRPLEDGNEVIYRINSPGQQVKPGASVCLLWNQTNASRFLEDISRAWNGNTWLEHAVTSKKLAGLVWPVKLFG
ncbi:hypothetical protein GOODEAATRI_005282 [Goodea atripinnis]|uniref:Uncharacterized protein n=1 Tax=Goodea atripinnis TaxID=208336 RepID=A0ABV0PL65_9TELE